ncbi:MAG TPA: hypothetical protein VEZ70_07090 [Allosphingosinicella sp.]|nr:hypothetical protein [Allosphingosinicella sp.]
MTHAARIVLADCQIALELLEEQEDEGRWRVHWVGAVALIRAVGHVLDKVDGQMPAIKETARAAFRRWNSDDPAHTIFREFIDAERNNILKEYQSKVFPNSDVPVAIMVTAVHPRTGETIQVPLAEVIPDNLYKPLVEGFGEGEDAREVYAEAIAWWGRELEEIDRAPRTTIGSLREL